MHVVCLKFQRIKTMLNISGCVENMLKISRHVENYNMCRKLCWNSMLKISHVLNTVTLAESKVKTSRRVENVYVRHVENHIENHVEVRKKDHHTLRHVSKLSGRFRFSPSVCTSYWSETYINMSLLPVWPFLIAVYWKCIVCLGKESAERTPTKRLYFKLNISYSTGNYWCG